MSERLSLCGMKVLKCDQITWLRWKKTAICSTCHLVNTHLCGETLEDEVILSLAQEQLCQGNLERYCNEGAGVV